jgi:hypothetical protein
MNAFVQGFGDELVKLAESDEKPSLGRGAAIGAGIGGGLGGLTGAGLGLLLGSRANHTLQEVLSLIGGAGLVGVPAAALGAGVGAGVQGIRRALHKDKEKTAGVATGVAKGVLGRAGKFVLKHPMLSIFGLYPAAREAGKAYAGRVKGPAASVLAAKPGQPSPYSNVNFHELFPHKLQPWQKHRLHRNYPAWRSRIGATS